MCGPGEPTEADMAEVEAFAAFLGDMLPHQRAFVEAAAKGERIELVHTRKGPRWTTSSSS